MTRYRIADAEVREAFKILGWDTEFETGKPVSECGYWLRRNLQGEIARVTIYFCPETFSIEEITPTEKIETPLQKKQEVERTPLNFLEECFLELERRGTRFDVPDDPSEASEMSMMSHIKAMKEAAK